MEMVASVLSRLKGLPKNIRIANIGMGMSGKGVFYQSRITPGIDCVAIADIDVDRCVLFVESMGVSYRIVDSLEEMHVAIHDGKVAICQDGDLLARCELMDVLVESTNSVGAGARFVKTALEHRKHVILRNAEVDLAFGPYFKDLASDNGVTVASCDGDQHGTIKHLVDELQLWGFELVMTGNIKGFLDRYSNPTSIIPEADKRNLDYKMATAFTDGTKLCVEMALIANALGLSTNVPGMLGPRANHVQDVLDIFDFEALWRDRQPCVDYILGGNPGGGVFVVGYCDDNYQKGMLSYYKMGDGPFYLFYRPYHLCHIEIASCIAEAALDNESFLKPDFGFHTNVFSYAKTNLAKGARLDGVGGYTCYGLIENGSNHRESPGLPICLAENVALNRNVSKDERILMSDINIPPDSFEFDLFHQAKLRSEALQRRGSGESEAGAID